MLDNICLLKHNTSMEWVVRFYDDFELEFAEFDEDLQDELLAHLSVLKQFGPMLGRPLVDTLKGSEFANMKELRFKLRGSLWRFAFAFDSERAAIVLIGGNKRGKNQEDFYDDLLKIADARFANHLSKLKKGK